MRAMIAGDRTVGHIHGMGARLCIQRSAQGAQKRRIAVRRKLARAARGRIVGLKERLDQTHQFTLIMHHGPELRHRLHQGQIAQIHTAQRRNRIERKQLFIAQVGALQIDHPRVLGKRAGQLTKACLHRVNQRRAVLDQAIGESAGAGSSVDAYAALHRDAEIADGAFQLISALAHVTLVQAAHRHGFVEGHQLSAVGYGLRAAVDRSAHQIRQGGFPAVKKTLLQKTVHGGAFFHTPSACSRGSQARMRSI